MDALFVSRGSINQTENRLALGLLLGHVLLPGVTLRFRASCCHSSSCLTLLYPSCLRGVSPVEGPAAECEEQTCAASAMIAGKDTHKRA